MRNIEKDMIHSTQNHKQKLYEFRGNQFKCDEHTVNQLNYALALNRSEERYVEVKKTKNKKEDGNDE